jgi:tetratricopeptide (TPR) repeat protein
MSGSMFRVPGSRFRVQGSRFAFAVLLFLVPPCHAQQIEPVRSGLLAVPMPALDDLEPAVAAQLREQRTMFESVAARARISDRDLAAAYHALGRLCHAYEFFDAAEAAYGNALGVAPQDVASRHLLGYLYQQTGRFDEALASYSAARRATPNDPVIRAHLAEVSLHLNRLADARDLFQDLTGVFPAVARAGLGEIALRQGRFSEAVEQLEAALDRAPNAASIHYSLGMAYRGLGRLDDARSHLSRRGTSTVRPADPLVDSLATLLRGERAQLMLGRRAYEAGQFDAARSAFSKALEAAPSSADAHVGLGMTLVQMGRDGEGIEHLKEASRSGATDEVNSVLIRLLLKVSRSDEALDVWSRTRSLAEDDEGAVLGLAILLSDRERYREAIDLLDSAWRQFPDRPRTATTLARLLAASPDRSLRDGARALTLAAGVYEQDRTPAHRETVALAMAELGRCAEAATWMQRAIADADRDRDAATAARLRHEMPRYSRTPCRP